eukprot:GDKK01049344.1.p1 GENE.GDKK01049344.1~~GDKK01049344.1.p1  ORF type:complete len:100 (-),score=22.36 GDKK01049344.1:25-324(-)
MNVSPRVNAEHKSEIQPFVDKRTPSARLSKNSSFPTYFVNESCLPNAAALISKIRSQILSLKFKFLKQSCTVFNSVSLSFIFATRRDTPNSTSSCRYLK